VDTDVQRLKDLMKEADVFVHGYRADAFENLGLGRDMRRSLNPHMIDVSLNAYGWSGPWVARRGFDSLVQMSCGIAALGMQEAGEARPVPLPVQALDHATGYLVAACVLEALSKRATGQITSARLSLAGTAHLLAQHRCACVSEGAIVQSSGDFDPKCETTGWGPAFRVKAPIDVSGQAMEWALGAGPLRRHDPHWS
jgi:crotonobetainyl-CoA:carnitine CoA-transferase CaiB-like acyl-CoA transferase